MIDNTATRMQEDPAEGLLLLAEGMMTGSAESYILRQEAEGQRQLVNSDRLPSDFGDDRAPWEALGFTFGEPDPDDPLFMPATLPAGWKREGSDHAMWSYITDEHGRRRAGVFYKAAFYDRKAHMHLTSLGSYVHDHVEYDGPLVITDEWATREAVAEEMRKIRDEHLLEALKFVGLATGDDPRRDEQNRARCAEIAAGKYAAAEKYDAALRRDLAAPHGSAGDAGQPS